MTTFLLLIIVVLLVAIFLRRVSRRQFRVSLRRGVLRLWLVLSATWIVLIALVFGDHRLSEVLIPPVVLATILTGVVWISEGFAAQPSTTDSVCRVEVIADGLLFRFRLQDDMIATVPSVQLFNDAMGDKELAAALKTWSAGANGPLDSLSSYPTMRDYLYDWAIDRSHCLGWKPPATIQGDEKALWVTPDRQTVWFRLPEGVSIHGVLSIPRGQFFEEVYSDRDLLAEFRTWMSGSAARSALSGHPRILAYLKQHTTEGKLTPIITDLRKA